MYTFVIVVHAYDTMYMDEHEDKHLFRLEYRRMVKTKVSRTA